MYVCAHEVSFTNEAWHKFTSSYDASTKNFLLIQMKLLNINQASFVDLISQCKKLISNALSFQEFIIIDL